MQLTKWRALSQCLKGTNKRAPTHCFLYLKLHFLLAKIPGMQAVRAAERGRNCVDLRFNAVVLANRLRDLRPLLHRNDFGELHPFGQILIAGRSGDKPPRRCGALRSDCVSDIDTAIDVHVPTDLGTPADGQAGTHLGDLVRREPLAPRQIPSIQNAASIGGDRAAFRSLQPVVRYYAPEAEHRASCST